MKDVNSKQKQQNFNLWAIMQQVKQSCRLELGDNREFRPGAFNQWTSSVSDPNLNDISDRSFAETLISGGIKKGSRPEGIRYLRVDELCAVVMDWGRAGEIETPESSVPAPAG